ncbi:PREDICTED: uncharacterized protein LOC107331644 [Acropora digitifera]|uniref:uncharacterized protein LOC107331644 n=1 Tax=Acropora digitifera TaxID=70779 RepID=UPI00077AF534|nr:PREDICTED: uncharacterized protein LOC107331644 [Acropora digitifera]
MRTTVILFDLLLLLAVYDGVTSSCFVMHNGCSVPLGIYVPYKSTFTPACKKHDVCYYCGQHWGWSQRDCDERFKKDMYKLCESKYGKKRIFGSLFNKERLCKSAGADVYYAAVRTGGHLYYESKSPDWCKETCTKNYGDPFKSL